MYAVFSRRVANPLAVFRLRWLGGWLLALVVGLLVAVPAWSQDDFLDPDDAFVLSAAMGSPERVDIHFKVAPEYYMYQERLEAVLEPETDASRLGELGLPPALVKYDITFEKDMPVYYGEYTLEIPVEAGADQPLTLTLTSQGCADAGLCYTPAEHVFTLTPTAEGYTLDGDGVVDAVPALADSTPPEAMQAADDTDAGGLFATGADDATASPDADLSTASDSAPSSGLDALMNLGDTGLAAWLGQAGIGKIVALSFVFGLLLSFTPCVLPMVPILLAILAGTDRQETLSRWRGFSLAAIFVLGMSLVYTVLGVAAGLVGASLAVWLQTPWVLTLFAILLGLFALAMFDVYTLQAPAALQNRLNERLNRIPGGRAGGVFVMGMVSALIVGPCVAAPLAGVLLFISQTGDIVLGGSALFAMAWGQGVLLLIVGLSSGLLMPRAGAWMQGIKTLFGLLLLA
ncbi:MAG TPA: protein-disulfide reductase DsbD, partial [Burkholderiaceae bacterium]|nr:protein-disulfide reductase DsbD [Burkholderiaceae bacterium]